VYSGDSPLASPLVSPHRADLLITTHGILAGRVATLTEMGWNPGYLFQYFAPAVGTNKRLVVTKNLVPGYFFSAPSAACFGTRVECWRYVELFAHT
jgi:hypothetical protein